MALAALDAWARVLSSGTIGKGAWRRIHPRYYPRIALGLATSCVGTIITLPERLIWAAFRAATITQRSRSRTTIVFVLGYYRSGTTHLHYLLSCDPNLRTPKWFQVMAPTGWWLSWTLVRWLLVPFLSSTRPQDDVAIGPEWPAEDDFASNNFNGACTMPGRMILPDEDSWAYYRRFHTLEGLAASERTRFERGLTGFVDRLSLGWCGSGRSWGDGHARRAILLKSPAHTARVETLVRLFGLDNVRFIHLSREPASVLRSNVAMHRRFEPYLFTDHPGDDVIRERIIDEYDRTERAFLVQSAHLPPGRVARMRYEDLVADPLGEVRRCYDELGLAWTPEFERRAKAYLASVRDYRTADKKGEARSEKTEAEKSEAGKAGAAKGEDIPERLRWMIEAFTHERPPVPHLAAAEARPSSVRLPASEPHTVAPARWLPRLAFAWSLCVCAWLLAAALAWDRMDWLVWPVGVALGMVVMRAGQLGTRGKDDKWGTVGRRDKEAFGRTPWVRGVVAAVATLACVLVVAFPATALTSDYRLRVPPNPPEWDHVWLSTRRGLTATNNIVYLVLGIMSAYRFASRTQPTVPGKM